MNVVLPILSSTVIFRNVKDRSSVSRSLANRCLTSETLASVSVTTKWARCMPFASVSQNSIVTLVSTYVGGGRRQELRHRGSPFLGDDDRLVLPLPRCLAGRQIARRDQPIVKGRSEHLIQVRPRRQAIAFKGPLLLPDDFDVERDVGRRRRGVDRPLSGEEADPPVLPCGEDKRCGKEQPDYERAFANECKRLVRRQLRPPVHNSGAEGAFRPYIVEHAGPLCTSILYQAARSKWTATWFIVSTRQLVKGAPLAATLGRITTQSSVHSTIRRPRTTLATSGGQAIRIRTLIRYWPGSLRTAMIDSAFTVTVFAKGRQLSPIDRAS